MENIIELPTQKPIKQKRLTIISTTVIVIIGLILGFWNLVSGGSGFYPNAKLFRDRQCGGYLLSTHPTMEIWSTYCFLTFDNEVQIHNWYRSRGWFRFGELLLFPKINLWLTQLMITREFNTEKQTNGSFLIVQSVRYVFLKPDSSYLSIP